jgi:hypothetical protein
MAWRMSDRFLRDHKLADKTYRLCGPLAPASVRDMTMRAEQLVFRLLTQGEITDDSRVLIVGAGVAGTCCAAALLSNCGCLVTLNDIAGSPLAVQTGVRHRQVTPHGFDWPYYFYRINRHPLFGSSVMPWKGGPADEVAKRFNRRLAVIAKRFGGGRLWNAMSNQIIHGQFDPNSGWEVEFTAPPVRGASRRQHYEVMLLCCGVSSERDTVAQYRGYRFWDYNDAFLSTKKYQLGPQDNVLICGGGDGGLNDFIRLATGESMPEKLVPQIEAVMHSKKVKFKERYQAVQALAHRHYLLSADSDFDHSINFYSFESHQRFARRLYRLQTMQQVLRGMLDADRPSVQLLVRQQSFGRCYTPNAMLVSLLARALVQFGNNGRAPIMLASQVDDVAPLGKIANPTWSADDWAAQGVRVTISPHPGTPWQPKSDEITALCDDHIAELAVNDERDYRAIFVRAGAESDEPKVVQGVRKAIGLAADPLAEIRHAVPQWPIR